MQVSNERTRRRSKVGQAIFEYAALLAFVASLIAIALITSNGPAGSAAATAFGALVTQLNNMTGFAASAS